MKRKLKASVYLLIPLSVFFLSLYCISLSANRNGYILFFVFIAVTLIHFFLFFVAGTIRLFKKVTWPRWLPSFLVMDLYIFIAIFVGFLAGKTLYPIREERYCKSEDAQNRALGEKVITAIKAYHEETGRYSDTLDALVPKYLDAVPKTVAGKKFHYMRSHDDEVRPEESCQQAPEYYGHVNGKCHFERYDLSFDTFSAQSYFVDGSWQVCRQWTPPGER